MSQGVCILAAGKSRRMGTTQSKIFTPLGGQPLLHYAWQAAQSLNPERIVLVVSKEYYGKVSQEFPAATVVIQDLPLGTGHAVQSLLPLWNTVDQWVVMCGDTPLLDKDALQDLMDFQDKGDIHLLTMEPESSQHAYGRLKMNSQGHVQGIVEFKDVAWSQASNLCYAGVMVIQANDRCRKALEGLAPHVRGKEIYLTDMAESVIRDAGTCTHSQGSFEVCLGINTQEDYAQATAILQNRWRQSWMKKGVRFLQPETNFLSFDTQLEKDVVIHPHVVFGSGVHVGLGSEILPFCYLESTHISDRCRVGPFAHMRGQSRLEKGVHVGSFVEVKKTVMGQDSRAKHLAYLGDTYVGRSVNVGGGVITCNYDGKAKHTTTLEDGAFIGSLSALVAPLTIGKEAMVAAGSVIRHDVKPGTLAYSLSPQQTREKS